MSQSTPPGPPPPPDEPPLAGGFSDATPPPPGRAEGLVAKSGFVVYEGGHSIFDESVLVYLARPRGQWPDFDVFDHVGRLLGFSRAKHSNSLFKMRSPSVYYDQQSNEILGLKPNFGSFNTTYNVTGVARGELATGASTMGALVMSANNERYGKIAGARFRGMLSTTLRILDEQENQVGTIRSFNEGGMFSRVHHYVVSVEPGLRGEIRRMLVAVPTVIATVRRQQQS